jgi:hypothetical protein
MPKVTPKCRQRVPRTRGGGTMTEAQFWSFIRSGLRSKSTRWPPRYHKLHSRRRTVTGKRHKYEYQCEGCQEWFKQKDIEADHIVACGSLRSWGDLPVFTQRLFCEEEGYQLLCKACHGNKNKEDRKK